MRAKWTSDFWASLQCYVAFSVLVNPFFNIEGSGTVPALTRQCSSDVDILKKWISILYYIFQNLYRYNIDIFKMLVIKERCYNYNLHPGMLDRYFLAIFHIIMGILFKKVDWLKSWKPPKILIISEKVKNKFFLAFQFSTKNSVGTYVYLLPELSNGARKVTIFKIL